MVIRLGVLVIYVFAIVIAFLVAPKVIFLLGLPWSAAAIMLQALVYHASSGDVLQWPLLFTIPNLILLIRSVLLKHVRDGIPVN